MKPATVDPMETDGSYRQELDAWKRAIIPAETRHVYRCPWPRCCWHTTDRPTLHDHIDRRHGGCTP